MTSAERRDVRPKVRRLGILSGIYPLRTHAIIGDTGAVMANLYTHMPVHLPTNSAS
jgi:hypothetical protein